MEKKGRFSSLEAHPQYPDASPSQEGAVLRDTTYYIQEAQRHELAGHPEKALTSYTAAVGEDPLFIEGWVNQLWMLTYVDEPSEAVMWADKALQYFPNHHDLLALKSLALSQIGQHTDARELNDRAMMSSRSSAHVWLARGQIQIADDAKSAFACFKKAVIHSINKGFVNMRAGDILLRHKKYTEAVRYYREASMLFPESPWIWYCLGRSQKALGRRSYARVAFQRASTLAPIDPRFRVELLKKYTWWEKILKWLQKDTDDA